MAAEDEAVSAVVRVSTEVTKSTADIIRFLLQLLVGTRGYGQGRKGFFSSLKGGAMSLGRGVTGVVDYGMGHFDGHGDRGEVDWRRALKWPDGATLSVAKDFLVDEENLENLKAALKAVGVDFAVKRCDQTGECLIAYRLKNKDLVNLVVPALTRMWAERKGIDPDDTDKASERMAEEARDPERSADPDVRKAPDAGRTAEAVRESRDTAASTVATASQWSLAAMVIDGARKWDEESGIKPSWNSEGGAMEMPRTSATRMAIDAICSKTGLDQTRLLSVVESALGHTLDSQVLSSLGVSATTSELSEALSAPAVQRVMRRTTEYDFGHPQPRHARPQPSPATPGPKGPGPGTHASRPSPAAGVPVGRGVLVYDPAAASDGIGNPVAESRTPDEVASEARASEGIPQEATRTESPALEAPRQSGRVIPEEWRLQPGTARQWNFCLDTVMKERRAGIPYDTGSFQHVLEREGRLPMWAVDQLLAARSDGRLEQAISELGITSSKFDLFAALDAPEAMRFDSYVLGLDRDGTLREGARTAAKSAVGHQAAPPTGTGRAASQGEWFPRPAGAAQTPAGARTPAQVAPAATAAASEPVGVTLGDEVPLEAYGDVGRHAPDEAAHRGGAHQ